MKASFVIPTFNNAAYLPHAVKSCQEQTCKDIEIIIIDDCSTDTTSEYIEWLVKQNDSRIVYKRNEKNMGRSYSRNLGNSIATGDIICVLDGDDLAINQRAEWTMKKLKKCQMCYGSAIFMDAIGTQLKEVTANPIDVERCLKPIDMTLFTKRLEAGESPDIREHGIVHSSVAYLREIALKYPYESGRVADMGIDDWEQQIRMMRDGVKMDFIPDVICAYRMYRSSIANTRDPLEVIKLKSEILEGSKCLKK